MISLQRNNATPLGDQIVTQISRLIEARTLPPGSKLPSIRQLAAKLQVSPYTVVNAYDRLIALGLAESRSTAGVYVKTQLPLPESHDEPLDSTGTLDIMWMAQRVLQLGEGQIAAGSAYVPPRWLEDTLSPAFLARAMHKLDTHRPAPPQGSLPLREQLALKLRGMGIPADTTCVMTTLGASQAIDLICRTHVSPGDVVLVEDPGYMLLFDRLQQAGARLFAVPRLPEGPDTHTIELICQTHKPRLFFTQTLMHNPTGWSSSAPTLYRLLSLAEKHDFLIAEDDVYGDLHAGNPLRLAQLSGLSPRTLYYSSFTKVLSPAWRLGYVAAPSHTIDVLIREKIRSVLTGSRFEEVILTELLRSGRYRKHVQMIRGKLDQLRAGAIKRLTNAGLKLDHADESGIFLWAQLPNQQPNQHSNQLPNQLPVDDLIRDAFDAGILLAKGDLFRLHAGAPQHLRFNIAHSNDLKLEQFLKGWLRKNVDCPNK